MAPSSAVDRALWQAVRLERLVGIDTPSNLLAVDRSVVLTQVAQSEATALDSECRAVAAETWKSPLF